MATLRSQFTQTLTNIEINGDKAARAKSAHEEIRAVLQADPQLHAWGVDTILIGSYSRDTGIYPGKDVDVFVRLTTLTTDAMPKKIYDAVWDSLVRAYGDAEQGGRATQQARSIKVAFPDADDPDDENAAFAVDTVPAVRDTERWAIPTKDRNRWTGSTGRWVTTDPERFGAMSRDLSTSPFSPTVGGRNAYKPIVKLMRQVRRAYLADRRPGGLFIEFAVYEAWSGGQVAGSEWDPLLAQTLRLVGLRLLLATELPLIDPALGTPVEPALTAEELNYAADTFIGLADRADEALTASDCQAALRWRQILGGNDRADPVFPLPPGCRADGTMSSSIAAVSSRTRSEATGFG